MNRDSSPLAGIFSSLAEGAPRHLALQGAAAPVHPFLAARLFLRTGSPLLLVTATAAEAQRIHEELTFYLPASETVLHFPAWEVLPFEPLSPSPEISAARISALDELLRAPAPVVVAPLESVLQHLVHPGRFASSGVELKRGDSLAWPRFFRRLSEGGYQRAEQVEGPGEYSRRGGILDFFPPSMPSPVRVELFGEEIESLRLFDPETQRNEGDLESVRILPARELLLDGQALLTLKKHLPPPGEEGAGDPLEDALRIPGLEHYQALLSRSRHTILDYFADPPIMVISEYGDVEARAEEFRKELRQEAERAVLPGLYDPARAYLDFSRWSALLRERPTLYFDSFGLAPPETETVRVDSSGGRSYVLAGRSEGSGESPLESTVRRLKEDQSRACILLVARKEESAARLGELCGEHDLGTRVIPPSEVPATIDSPEPGAPRITFGSVAEGFLLPRENLLVVTEEDIFGAKVRRHVPKPSKKKGFMPDFHLLKPGDFLVHVEHGIGVYGGLERLEAGGEEADFLVLSYEGGDKVYVPPHGMDAVQRYVSWEGNRPRIDKLGGKMWAATKRKAKKALVTLARDLLRLYAIRQSTPGHAFPADTPWQAEFEMGFEYTETEDQIKAAEEIKADMEKPSPMDRLVCGDVGFGKTEVAMRAAFKAVMDSRQVAILAPTTLLVQQHLSTFRKRFGPYPARIEMLSRFATAAQQKKTVADLAAGAVDVVIGTHRLLGKDVRFRDLGLIIIDEEQRFGVRHKEKLKQFRETVDVLSLTATPIPRTLYLSLSGIRELSQISTPPENRLAIRNTVSRFDAELIREAVLREVRRGGQVFFIHNRVQSIGGIGNYLQRLLPEVRIGIAHGQMSEKGLDKVMARFREGEHDLLLCTTIVESGLDISNANTMIINRADAFGLSELYQLRGRIGRSRHRAYAYFLIPPSGALSPAGRKRIEVIRDFAHLGAGFQIAIYDLEIRGAGSVLGYRQSGHIAAVGFEMYTRLLQETIRELQGEPAEAARPTRVSLPFPTYIPDKYLEEINQRLTFYKKIADASSGEELEEVAAELRERYGPLPEPALSLVWGAHLKILGERADVKNLEWTEGALEIRFYPQCSVAPEKIVSLLAEAPAGSGMKGADLLRRGWASETSSDRFAEAQEVLRGLQ
jgi:transcription-repair coupling factor (superfamily II helicase)